MIVVEGFFDSMRVHQAGFPNVVALMGARLSAAQKDLLANQFSGVVLMLDGDPTGRAAMAQVAAQLRPECRVRQVLLSTDLQPDRMSANQIRDALGSPAERRPELGAH
jgi:DNA primase